MQAIHDAWDRNKADLAEALLYNRKLWSIFLTEVTGPDHPLPAEIRQNVANLGMFVINQTLSVTRGSEAANHLGSLININRQLAAGPARSAGVTPGSKPRIANGAGQPRAELRFGNA